MTGRKLYDKYTDATANNFAGNRGGYSTADTPIPAWPSLSHANRARWNDLARAITPKPRPKV
jgi:hypothetical protein